MVEPIGVEYVCTGNNGRSPLAEAVARAYLQTNYTSLSDGIRISSSGTDAEWINQKVITGFDRALTYLKKGHTYNSVHPGLLTPDEVTFIEENLLRDKEAAAAQYGHDPTFRSIVHVLAVETRKKLGVLEREHRDHFLAEYGLSYVGQRTPIQPRDDVHYVLGMGRNNVGVIQRAYAGRDHMPVIALISEFVGEDGEIVDALGSPDLDVHRRAFEQVTDLSKRSIDNVVSLEFSS